jgi:hypothetical protein
MPDVTQTAGLFWATVFGAALGIIAGTIIQYFLSLALDWTLAIFGFQAVPAHCKLLILFSSLVCRLVS